MKKMTALIGMGMLGLITLQSGAQPKLGYVHMQELIAAMPETAHVDTAMADFQKQQYQQYQAMQQEFQGDAAAFVKDSATMTAAVKEVRRSSLQDLNNRIVQFQQNASQEASKKYNALMQPVVSKVDSAVNMVAKSKGYTYVLDDDTSPGDLPTIVSKPATDDLTAAVKAQLKLK